jgi:FdhD protein
MMILRWDGQAPHEQPDELAEEEPLEIRVRGRAVSVTMRTPGHDEELALGFLLIEGSSARRATCCASSRAAATRTAICSTSCSRPRCR